jgi:hypothetical protein
VRAGGRFRFGGPAELHCGRAPARSGAHAHRADGRPHKDRSYGVAPSPPDRAARDVSRSTPPDSSTSTQRLASSGREEARVHSGHRGLCASHHRLELTRRPGHRPDVGDGAAANTIDFASSGCSRSPRRQSHPSLLGRPPLASALIRDALSVGPPTGHRGPNPGHSSVSAWTGEPPVMPPRQIRPMSIFRQSTLMSVIRTRHLRCPHAGRYRPATQPRARTTPIYLAHQETFLVADVATRSGDDADGKHP